MMNKEELQREVDTGENIDRLIEHQTSNIPTNSEIMPTFRRGHGHKWALCMIIFSSLLLLLIVSVLVILGVFLDNTPFTPPLTNRQGFKYVHKFEFSTSDSKEEVVVDIKENTTELISESIRVLNYFRKGLSIHKVYFANGDFICLMKHLEDEADPRHLQEALGRPRTLEVNKTVYFSVTDLTPVPYYLTQDMKVHQLCDNTHMYYLAPLSGGKDHSIPIEQLVNASKPNHQVVKRSLSRDLHNSPAYHSGGPIGKQHYVCTKVQNICYINLKHDRCSECYHGHNWRTRDCWCPIKAIKTCIKLWWTPVERYCRSSNEDQCIQIECESSAYTAELEPPQISIRVIPK